MLRQCVLDGKVDAGDLGISASAPADELTYASVAAIVNDVLTEAGHWQFKDTSHAMDESIGTICDAADGQDPSPEIRDVFIKGFASSSGAGEHVAGQAFDAMVSGCRSLGFSKAP